MELDLLLLYIDSLRSSEHLDALRASECDLQGPEVGILAAHVLIEQLDEFALESDGDGQLLEPVRVPNGCHEHLDLLRGRTASLPQLELKFLQLLHFGLLGTAQKGTHFFHLLELALLVKLVEYVRVLQGLKLAEAA